MIPRDPLTGRDRSSVGIDVPPGADDARGGRRDHLEVGRVVLHRYGELPERRGAGKRATAVTEEAPLGGGVVAVVAGAQQAVMAAVPASGAGGDGGGGAGS